MITGRQPYGELSEEDIINALKSENEAPPVSLRVEAVTVPSSLDLILSRALRKRRDERYASANEMSTDLEELKSLIDVSRQEKSQKLLRAQNANRQLTQLAVLYDANRNTRIPVGSLWSIWRFADLKRGILERETIRRSVLSALIKIGSLVLVVAIVTLAIAAAKSVNDVWEESVMRDGHTAAVRQAVFSPDGRLLVSVGEDKQVIVWDFARRERLKTLSDHTGWVTSVAFSPDGKTLAAIFGYPDYTIQFWTVPEGERLFSIKGHEWSYEFSQVVFSPGGQTLATVSKNEDGMDLGMVELWRAADGERLYQLEMAGVMRVAFSKDGDILATGSYDHTVRLWRAADGALLKILLGHGDYVTDLAFSPSGELLASGSYDGTVILWGVPSEP